MTAEAKERMLQDLTTAIVERLELEKTKDIAGRALESGAKPLEIVDAVSEGLDRVEISTRDGSTS